MPGRRLTHPHGLRELGAYLGVAVAAIAVYTRFSYRLSLNRDEGIYVYSSLRLTHGVPPYRSIFDPKTPGTSMLGALAIEFGKLVGLAPVTAIRLVFFGTAVLTALAVYLLGRVLWDSVVAGLIGAGIFLCFQSWAFAASVGPDAKMPGILLAVLSMALVVRRHWVAAGLAAGLGFLFWQPLLVFVATAVLAALLWRGGGRVRAGAGALVAAAIAIVACGVYFAAVGAFRLFVDAAFVQPATANMDSPGLRANIVHIQYIAVRFERFDMWTLWIGLGLLLAAAAVRLVRGARTPMATIADPLVCSVGLSLVAVIAFSITDFQSYPDLEPLLPFVGLGFGGLYVALRAALTDGPGRRRTVRAGLATVSGLATLGVLAASVSVFSADPARGLPSVPRLRVQRAQACAVSRIAGPGTVWALGDPVTLALNGRVNPDKYIYFGGGVLTWKLEHLPHGFRSWQRQILEVDPALFTAVDFHDADQSRMFAWLQRRGYRFTWVGNTRVILTPRAIRRAGRLGIPLLPHPMLLHGRADLVGYTSPACAR